MESAEVMDNVITGSLYMPPVQKAPLISHYTYALYQSFSSLYFILLNMFLYVAYL
jgi:hypothetical protein